MRIITFILCCAMTILSLPSYSLSQVGMGATPLKYISSCELDLNNDKERDIALLVETIRGRELIVLFKTPTGYNAFLVSEGKSDMYLTCHFGKFIKETSAGIGKREEKAYKTNGTYIKLQRPESSSFAYFWDETKKSFQEVWTSD